MTEFRRVLFRSNASVNDSQNLGNSTVKWWKDNTRFAIYYPYVTASGTEGSTIDLGVVNAGIWNNGTGTMSGNNNIKNVGNVNGTTIEWNGTDFTGGTGGSIPIDPCTSPCSGFSTTFAVDTDLIPDGSGWLNDNPLTRITFPSYGVYRCQDFTCTNPTEARYPLYWHIYIPGGRAGTFTDLIELYATTSMTC